MKRKIGAEVPALQSAKNSLSSFDNQFIRNFDHVDGNWPSHIFLSGKGSIAKISALCCDHFSITSPELAPVAIDEPHLSLSKSFVLRSHQIQPFILHLGNLMSSLKTFSAVIHSSYQLLLNDNQTRIFLALPVEDNDRQVLKAVQCVDEALSMFRQPTYYTCPLFHISIASQAIVSNEVRAFISDSVDTQRIVTVGREFYLAHEDQLTESANSDDSDDEPDVWNNSNMIVNNSQVLPTAVSTVPVKGVLGGLLDGYNSDSSDQTDQPITTEPVEVPALSKIITFDTVECRIGNRVFRFDLCDSLACQDSVRDVFYEVFPNK